MFSSESAVLDTLKFKDGKIFLKRFHQDRTFEALCFDHPLLKSEEVAKVYDHLEKQKLSSNQLLRIHFQMEEKLHYHVEVIEKSFLPDTIRLQIITGPQQLAGRGKQNYKWSRRDFWEEVLKLKEASADDIISLNAKNQITETSRCNLFLYDLNEDLVFTPTLDSGCINGVYRRYVMQNKKIILPRLGEKKLIEKDFFAEDLKNLKIYVANSVREVKLAILQ